MISTPRVFSDILYLMEKLIVTLPDKRLRQKSEPVIKIDASVHNDITTMKQAAIDWENSRPNELSSALAAVQIGIMRQIIIIREEMSDPTKQNFIALINPEIIKATGRKEVDFEGCLSVPDFYGKVPRFPKIKVKAKTEDGETVFIKAEGFMSRTLQHEIDHLNGIPFVDHIKGQTESFYKLDRSGKLRKVSYDKVVATGIFRD